MARKISALRKRSNAFVRYLNVHIARVVEESKEIVKLNQKQLRSSKLITGQPITPLYSLPYARMKGYRKPDGYLTGEMYKEMDIFVNENNGTYFITSFAPHTRFFVGRYGRVFGVTKANQPAAQKITSKRIFILYKRLVIKR